MNIGIFSSSLPSPERKPGGVDVFVDRLANKLTARSHRVTVFSYSAAPPASAYGAVRLSPDWFAHGKLARLCLVPASLNWLDTDGLDVLHLHGDDWFFQRRRVPTVRTFHGSARHEARTATGHKRRLVQSATFLLEVRASRLATGAYTLAEGQDPVYRPTGALFNGVDIPDTVQTRRDGNPSILFVGTWQGRKRGEALFEAFGRDIRPAFPGAQLHMVSDHCEAAPGVHWHRRPSDAELAELYRRAWVFCLPSAYEGFGMPYAEAMAAGTPVLTTANPGALSVLDGGRAGVVVELEELGRALRDLLGDPGRRTALAEAGRERVKAFAWDAVLDTHERAYARAIADWPGRSGSRRLGGGPRLALGRAGESR